MLRISYNDLERLLFPRTATGAFLPVLDLAAALTIICLGPIDTFQFIRTFIQTNFIMRHCKKHPEYIDALTERYVTAIERNIDSGLYDVPKDTIDMVEDYRNGSTTGRTPKDRS
jgi:hypothetical protein